MRRAGRFLCLSFVEGKTMKPEVFIRWLTVIPFLCFCGAGMAAEAAQIICVWMPERGLCGCLLRPRSIGIFPTEAVFSSHRTCEANQGNTKP